MVRVLELTEIGPVTGEHSANRTGSGFGVYGTDLGIIWESGPGQVLVAFGDSYGQGWGGNGAGPAHADWRCNFVARSTSDDLKHGLLLEPVSRRGDGAAEQAIARDLDADHEATVIPTSGVSINGRDYLHYMSVNSWGEPGHWQTNYGGIAFSEDKGATWHKPESARWPAVRRGGFGFHKPKPHPFQLGAFALAGEHVYLFGTPAGRFGGVSLARVEPDHVLDASRYRYWSGADFAADDAFDAVAVMPGPVGELSVRYHPASGQWLAMHLDEHRAAIVLRSAPSLAGPWTEGVVVVQGAQYPALYGGFLHPWSSGDRELFFTMSQWGPYNVTLMRAVIAPD